MSVYRKGGVYHYRFMHCGRVVRRSTKQRNYKAACDMENAHRTALSKGEAGLGEKPLIPSLSQFLNNRIAPWADKQKLTTRTWYYSGVTPPLSYKPIAGCILSEITSENVADYTAHREAEGRKVGTINRELRVLRRVLRLASEWGVIATPPPAVDAWTLCKIMGWASLSVAMTYIHPDEEKLEGVFSGHKFGHVGNTRISSEKPESAQLAEKANCYMVSAAGLEPATHALKEYPSCGEGCRSSAHEQRQTIRNMGPSTIGRRLCATCITLGHSWFYI
jgi:hypothetical protein